MNSQDTINLILEHLKTLHEYELACKFKHRLFVHRHSAVLPVAFVEEALVFVHTVKPHLQGLEKKWYFVHPNIKADVRSHMNVFNNLKTQYDIFQSCLAGANIPLFFRQADVTPIVEQIMKERERAEKRFQRERAKHQVKPTNLLDGLGEALQVANDRRRIEESTYVRPKNHGKERRNRKQHTDAADSAGGK